MGSGKSGMQAGGNSILYEHVHKYRVTGIHQLGQILKAEEER